MLSLSPTLNGCQSGLGILVQSGGGSSVVTIANSSIHDYQKNGITANEAGTHVTISGNVVTGLGTAAAARHRTAFRLASERQGRSMRIR